MVVEADAQGQPVRAELRAQRQQGGGVIAHRLHGVGEHQGAEPPPERVAQHGRQLAVEERLAAGEAHLLHGQAVAGDLVQVARHLRGRHVRQGVVARAALDVAVAAGDVAQRAGVDPERPQPRQGHRRPPLPLGRHPRVAELRRIERMRLRPGFVQCHGAVGLLVSADARRLRRLGRGWMGMPGSGQPPPRSPRFRAAVGGCAPIQVASSARDAAAPGTRAGAALLAESSAASGRNE